MFHFIIGMVLYFTYTNSCWKKYNVDYQQLTTIRPRAPIEFYIPASTKEYLNCKNSRLHVSKNWIGMFTGCDRCTYQWCLSIVFGPTLNCFSTIDLIHTTTIFVGIQAPLVIKFMIQKKLLVRSALCSAFAKILQVHLIPLKQMLLLQTMLSLDFIKPQVGML